mmetsp:Transcript_97113/g.271830  ORF Transcript_97113/g.271830 Transcript_97113/m.271830 type:complete len:416 (-) Transcript_97113:939-2186(-)
MGLAAVDQRLQGHCGGPLEGRHLLGPGLGGRHSGNDRGVPGAFEYGAAHGEHGDGRPRSGELGDVQWQQPGALALPSAVAPGDGVGDGSAERLAFVGQGGDGPHSSRVGEEERVLQGLRPGSGRGLGPALARPRCRPQGLCRGGRAGGVGRPGRTASARSRAQASIHGQPWGLAGDLAGARFWAVGARGLSRACPALSLPRAHGARRPRRRRRRRDPRGRRGLAGRGHARRLVPCRCACQEREGALRRGARRSCAGGYLCDAGLACDLQSFRQWGFCDSDALPCSARQLWHQGDAARRSEVSARRCRHQASELLGPMCRCIFGLQLGHRRGQVVQFEPLAWQAPGLGQASGVRSIAIWDVRRSCRGTGERRCCTASPRTLGRLGRLCLRSFDLVGPGPAGGVEVGADFGCGLRIA